MPEELYWSKERFAEARKRGYFTAPENGKASEWTTCACGQQDGRIARNSDGAPVDRDLQKLGLDFVDAVNSDDFDEAESLLQRIETRAAVVIGLQEEV